MKKRNFKVYFSAIVGVAVAMGFGIVRNDMQPNGVGEDLIVQIGIIAVWAAKMLRPFFITFIIVFIAMLVWQKAHHKSFLSARTKFFQWWDRMKEWMKEWLEDAISC